MRKLKCPREGELRNTYFPMEGEWRETRFPFKHHISGGKRVAENAFSGVSSNIHGKVSCRKRVFWLKASSGKRFFPA